MATAAADILAITDPIVPNGRRDSAPAGTPYPLLVVALDFFPSRKIRSGDGRSLAWLHTHAVDVWQYAEGEDDTIVPRLIEALDGGRCTDGRRGLHVISHQRQWDPDDNEQDLIHVTIMLSMIEPR